jgi:hypothetical protein
MVRDKKGNTGVQDEIVLAHWATFYEDDNVTFPSKISNFLGGMCQLHREEPTASKGEGGWGGGGGRQ